MTMVPYVIRQGDYLARLAERLGFSADEIWNASENAELKAKRPDPNILCPGDVLYVPDAPKPPLPLTAQSSNDYSARVPTIQVKLLLRDASGPLASEPYTIQGLADEVKGETGGDGSLSFDAPVHVGEVLLVLTKRRVEHQVMIGHLDPIDEPSGVRDRLSHLGYLPPPDDPSQAANDEAEWAAIAMFQRLNGLPETGTMDDGTKEALLGAHGS